MARLIGTELIEKAEVIKSSAKVFCRNWRITIIVSMKFSQRWKRITNKKRVMGSHSIKEMRNSWTKKFHSSLIIWEK